MATVDRIESGYRTWTPSAAGYAEPAAGEHADEYVGRHRKPSTRRLGVLSMFYVGRHRRR